jgi:hypothetical protein
MGEGVVGVKIKMWTSGAAVDKCWLEAWRNAVLVGGRE